MLEAVRAVSNRNTLSNPRRTPIQTPLQVSRISFQRLMRRAPWTEPIGAIFIIRFEDRLQNQQGRHSGSPGLAGTSVSPGKGRNLRWPSQCTRASLAAVGRFWSATIPDLRPSHSSLIIEKANGSCDPWDTRQCEDPVPDSVRTALLDSGADLRSGF